MSTWSSGWLRQFVNQIHQIANVSDCDGMMDLWPENFSNKFVVGGKVKLTRVMKGTIKVFNDIALQDKLETDLMWSF